MKTKFVQIFSLLRRLRSLTFTISTLRWWLSMGLHQNWYVLLNKTITLLIFLRIPIQLLAILLYRKCGRKSGIPIFLLRCCWLYLWWYNCFWLYYTSSVLFLLQQLGFHACQCSIFTINIFIYYLVKLYTFDILKVYIKTNLTIPHMTIFVFT